MGAMCKMIQPERVLLDIEPADKRALLSELVNLLGSSGDVLDADQLLEDIMERELLSSTAIGSACAVPHAHSHGVKSTIVAAARLSNSLDFGADDQVDSRLVFIVVGPPKNTGLHLKVLSKLARLLHDPGIRESLMTSQSPDEFYHSLCGSEG